MPPDPAAMIGKRLLDIVGASLLLVPMIVIGLPLLIAIRWESKGSPLFVQRRVGHRQRPFRLLKLRTMAISTPHVASHVVGAHGITRLGRILRHTKLDELPQVWNVLVGDMSFVGPRPCLPSQRDLIDAREREGAFAVRPGITGPAQINGIDMSRPQLLAEMDGQYARSLTLWGDLAIIIHTVAGKGAGDAAR
jgi:O-antigen biosynthesis protein WbqP